MHTALLNDIGLSHVFAQRIERCGLRFVHALDVNVHGERECRVPENRLDVFRVHAQPVQVRREPAAESVPAAPADFLQGKRVVNAVTGDVNFSFRLGPILGSFVT